MSELPGDDNSVAVAIPLATQVWCRSRGRREIHAQWFCEGAAQVAKLGVRSRGSGYTALKAFENTASWYRHRLRTGHV